MNGVNVKTRYLADYLSRIDELHRSKAISTAEYMMISLQMKSLEALLQLQAYAGDEEIK